MRSQCFEMPWKQEPQFFVLLELRAFMLYTAEGPIKFKANIRYDWSALVAPMLALRKLVPGFAGKAQVHFRDSLIC